MAGYTRQSASSIINGSDITAPPLNAEFNKVVDSFNNTTGHKHDGTPAEGPVIGIIGDAGVLSPTNKVIVDTTNSMIRFFVNASGAGTTVEQVRVQDGAITPAYLNDIDLGLVNAPFKNLFLQGNVSADGNGSVGGTLSVTGQLTASGGSVLNGLTTLAQVDANSGTIDNTVIGGNTASPITGTTITSTGGFTGDIVGDVTGNVTSAGTSGFNNITASGTITGNVTGDVTGNLTATTGTSQFNNVTVNGTLNMDAGTTGTITNLTTPTNANDAATKGYVDTGLAALVDSSPAALDTLNELAAAINDDANFSTTMTNALAGKVADTGDTMTGNLTMSGATVTGLPLPTANTEAASKQYTDQQDALQVSRAGDSMSGPLAMGLNKITGLGTPTANTDASTKGYTDGILGSATAASNSAAAAATSEANAAVSEATALGHANTAATSITTAQQFLDTYHVSASAPTGASVTEGDLWFDTTAQILKVRSSSGFQNAGSSVNGTAERKDYTATSGQTSFAATYDPTYVDVYLNGVKLAPVDFTATDGANVVLASATASGDTVSIVSFGTFELADHYNKTTVDALIDDVETLALAGM